MDPYRLPTSVRPLRYELRLEPDLTSCRFRGEEIVTLTLSEATQEILLNAADLEVHEATVHADGDAPVACRIELDERLERCRLSSPVTLRPGTHRLRLSFHGILNDKLRGFYRSTYTDEGGRTRTLAATQFEATDARRAFPCWDEPAFKAVFSTTLVVDPDLTVVSNTAVQSERIEAGQKIVTFHDTIRMSSYLVAFIVGALECTEPVYVDRVPIRIWCVPGKRHLARFAQDIAAFSLRCFQDYYSLPYPGDKLDLLAIPDFASGAMENLGAITFRETALLAEERAATHHELARIADVVAHENAHMWFGDLVTMSWWNGLWLNEAFATFMEMLAVDAWKPAWDRWSAFGVSRGAALAVDGLHSTRPIEYEVRAPHDADAMFDVLTYEKGASVLRMLEQHLGPQVFRDGVRAYLRTHAYGNADTHDLWAALGQTADEPVPALMERWIFGEGYPLILVERRGEEAITLRQQRFTYLPVPASQEASAAARWHVPVQLRLTAGGHSRSIRLMLAEAETSVPLPEGFESLLLNEGGHGFYRVRYEPDLLQRLLALLPDGCSGIERFNLVNDAWASTLAGHLPVTEYLDLTARFREDRDKDVWAVLIESFHLLARMVRPEDRPYLEAYVRDRMAPVVAQLGWLPAQSEDERTRQLRGDAIRALGTVGNARDVQQRAAQLVDTGGEGAPVIDSNVWPAIVSVLAHGGDEPRYEEFRRRMGAATTPQDERRYLFALTQFPHERLLDRTLQGTLNGAIRTQDGPFVVSAVLQNVAGRDCAWRFVQQRWEDLERAFPKQGLRRMCGGILGLTTPELESQVRRFFESRKIDLGGKLLAQYLEQLRVLVAFRERTLAELSAYLGRFPAA